jgi:hypothetical protein
MNNNVLRVGQTLSVGNSLLSSQGSYELKMNSDGTLMIVRTADSYSIWYSSSQGPEGAYFANLGSDGNLVIQEGQPDSPGAVHWLANGVVFPGGLPWGFAFPGPDFYAIMGDDGNFSVRRGTGPNADKTYNDAGLIWQTGPDYTAVAGLGPIQNNASQNGLFSLRLVGDVLQVVGPDGVRWSSPGGGNPNSIALLMPDGNFGVYLSDSSGGGVRTPIWQTGITCRASDSTRPFVLLENDGNLAVHDNWGRLWSADCGVAGGVPPPAPAPVAAAISQFNGILQQAAVPFPSYSGDEQAAFEKINSDLAQFTPLKLWDGVEGIEEDWIEAIRIQNQPLSDTPPWQTVLADIVGVLGDLTAVTQFVKDMKSVALASNVWMQEKIQAVTIMASLGQSVAIVLGGGDAGTVLGIIAAPLSLIPGVGAGTAAACAIAQGVITLAGDAAIVTNPALARMQAAEAQLINQLADCESALNAELDGFEATVVADYGKLRAAAALFSVASAEWAKEAAAAFSPTNLIPVEVVFWKAILAAGFTIQNMVYDGTPGLPGNAFIDTGDYPSFEASNVPAVGAWLDRLYPGSLQEPADPQPRPGCWARFRAIASAGDGTWLGAQALHQLFVVLGVPVEDVFDGRNGWSLPRTSYRGSYPFNLALQIAESSYWGPSPPTP